MQETILFQREARKRLLHGAEILMESVKGTLGPCGHHVVIQKQYGQPLVTNDGVSIAKALHVNDPYEQMGIQILLDSAIKTNENSGDGTTTSILLAYELLKHGYAYMEQGGVANAFVEGMEEAAKMIEEYIREHCKKITAYEEIAQIATISAKSEEIGTLVAEGLREVSDPRCIVCEGGRSFESKIRIQEGMEVNATLMSPYFFPKDEVSTTLKQPYILISNHRIDAMSEIEHLLAFALTTHHPLILICEDMESDVLAQLILLHVQKKCDVMVLKAPSFGTYQQDMLEDLALLCGGTACIADLNRELSDVAVDELGIAKEAIVHKRSLQVFAKRSEPVEEKIKQLKKQLPSYTKKYDIDHIYQRISRLEGKLAILEIGGYTKGEIEEKKLRCEDALQAAFAAMDEGVVPGGGLALLQAYKALQPIVAHDVQKDREAGISCVFAAILKPFLQLMENNYEQPVEMLELQFEKEMNIGYDVWKETWCDLSANGILDPVKVVLQALHNAISVASLLIRCDVAMLAQTS